LTQGGYDSAMRSWWPLLLAAGMLVGMASPAFCDNLLQNADFKSGTQGWHGDGRAVFLRPDGTEGSETDTGAVPVLRLTLAKGHPLSVYQAIRSKDAIGKLNLSVQVYASIDFKRSTHASDYELEGEWLQMPVVDFMVRLMPDFWENDGSLKAGQWVTINGMWSAMTSAYERSIFFVVPPGEGYVYIKNPTLTP